MSGKPIPSLFLKSKTFKNQEEKKNENTTNYIHALKPLQKDSSQTRENVSLQPKVEAKIQTKHKKNPSKQGLVPALRPRLKPEAVPTIESYFKKSESSDFIKPIKQKLDESITLEETEIPLLKKIKPNPHSVVASTTKDPSPESITNYEVHTPQEELRDQQQQQDDLSLLFNSKTTNIEDPRTYYQLFESKTSQFELPRPDKKSIDQWLKKLISKDLNTPTICFCQSESGFGATFTLKKLAQENGLLIQIVDEFIHPTNLEQKQHEFISNVLEPLVSNSKPTLIVWKNCFHNVKDFTKVIQICNSSLAETKKEIKTEDGESYFQDTIVRLPNPILIMLTSETRYDPRVMKFLNLKNEIKALQSYQNAKIVPPLVFKFEFPNPGQIQNFIQSIFGYYMFDVTNSKIKHQIESIAADSENLFHIVRQITAFMHQNNWNIHEEPLSKPLRKSTKEIPSESKLTNLDIVKENDIFIDDSIMSLSHLWQEMNRTFENQHSTIFKLFSNLSFDPNPFTFGFLFRCICAEIIEKGKSVKDWKYFYLGHLKAFTSCQDKFSNDFWEKSDKYKIGLVCFQMLRNLKLFWTRIPHSKFPASFNSKIYSGQNSHKIGWNFKLSICNPTLQLKASQNLENLYWLANMIAFDMFQISQNPDLMESKIKDPKFKIFEWQEKFYSSFIEWMDSTNKRTMMDLTSHTSKKKATDLKLLIAKSKVFDLQVKYAAQLFCYGISDNVIKNLIDIMQLSKLKFKNDEKGIPIHIQNLIVSMGSLSKVLKIAMEYATGNANYNERLFSKDFGNQKSLTVNII